MRELDRDFAALGVEVRFIGIGDRAKVEGFCARFNAAATCIADPTKASYAAMGFGDFDLTTLQTHPALQIRRAEANAKGFTLDTTATIMDDATQLPGVALVDRDGIVRYLHRGEHPGDLPPMRDLLAIARRTLRR